MLSKRINYPIVELEEGQMQLRDDEVNIISWIADQGSSLGISGKIIGLAYIVSTEQKLICIIEIIQKRFATRSSSIERFEIQTGRSEIA